MSDYRLSDAESYIMHCFWQHGPMKTDQLSRLVADRGWKPTTLLTFLSRLVSKGMLQAEKQGKANLYRPCVTLAEYQGREGRAFLDEVYGGSARDFLASMVNSKGLDAADIAELRSWLAGQEVDDHG